LCRPKQLLATHPARQPSTLDGCFRHARHRGSLSFPTLLPDDSR
jgi:hypothetical protein